MRALWITLVVAGSLGASASGQNAVGRDAVGQDAASRFGCTQQQAGVGSLRAANAAPSCARPPQPLPRVRIVGTADPSLCGQCLRITIPEDAITAFVTGTSLPDRGQLPGDLLADAATLAELGFTAGTQLSWVTIPCPFETSIEVDVELVSNQLRVTVRGSTAGLATARLKELSGSRIFDRGPANDFRLAAPGPPPWRIEVEDVHSRRLDLGALSPGKAQSTKVQFPRCALLFTDGFEGGDLSSWGRQTGP